MEILVILLLLAIVWLFILYERLRKRVAAIEAGQTGLTPEALSPAGQQAEQAAPRDARQQATRKAAAEANTPWTRSGAAASDLPVEASGPATDAPQDAPETAAQTPSNYVFTPDFFSRTLRWAATNWFYLVAAISLALAGVFLVQYGIENGLLPPAMRVAFALLLGAGLIALAEVLRRKGGDAEGDLFANLPSTFAAGGLVSMFAAVVSARVLYDLIAPGPALAGLSAVAALAILIGWFYGPLLAAIGILGGMIAPFLVGGDPGAAGLLYYYFALIAVAALAVDTFKRWAWLSAFASVLGFAAAGTLFVQAGEPAHFLAFAVILAAAAAIIPERRLTPRHTGSMVIESFRRSTETKRDPSSFPTRLAAGVFCAASVVPLWVQSEGLIWFWPAVSATVILLAMALIWMRNALALADVTLVPLAGMLLLLIQQAELSGPVWVTWHEAANRLPETAAPWTVLILLAIGIVVSLLLAWRSALTPAYPVVWAMAAAAFAPAVVAVLEVYWTPARVIGASTWAWQVVLAGGIMVVLAERFGRIDGDNRQRPALFTLAALTMISLALMLLLSDTALTLALAAMVLAAVALDRRFNMAYLGIFVIVGTGVCGWRLVFDPGIFWGIEAPFLQVLAAYGGSVLLIGAAWVLLKGRDRPKTFAVVDAAFWSFAATFASVMVIHFIDWAAPSHKDSNATASLIAQVWLISAANQLWRLRRPDVRRVIRILLALLYGLPGLLLLAVVLTFLNPLFENWNTAFGPYILDSLFVAYALPGLLFQAVAIRFDHLHRWLRYGFALFGGFLVTLYVGMEIRRFWRGDDLTVPGTTNPELYTYTVAMLLVSTGLLFYAFWKHSKWLRKLALVGIGLTVAKVFLIDFSGLTGLTRVFSFLVLGLALAGLAWLDRWFGAREAKPASQDTTPQS